MDSWPWDFIILDFIPHSSLLSILVFNKYKCMLIKRKQRLACFSEVPMCAFILENDSLHTSKRGCVFPVKFMAICSNALANKMFFCLCRKLLRGHKLDVTKTAQHEELERRRRLGEHRKQDFNAPLQPEGPTSESTVHIYLSVLFFSLCYLIFIIYLSSSSGDAAQHVPSSTASVSFQQEVKSTRQEVISLDSGRLSEDAVKTSTPASVATEQTQKTGINGSCLSHSSLQQHTTSSE